MTPPVLAFEPSSRSGAAKLLGARASALTWAGLALAAAGFAWLAATGWTLVQAEQRRAALQARMDATRVTAAMPARPSNSNRALNAQRLRAWNAVAQQLNIPWTALLDTLETVTPDDVALVSVEPQAAQSAVRLQAEARTLQGLLAYQQALGAAPLFREVALARHETSETNPVRPVRVHLILRMHATHGGAGK